MTTTLLTVGNGGYNIAADAIQSGIFSDYKLIVCDSDPEDLKRNSELTDCSFLLDIPNSQFWNNPQIKSIVDEMTGRIYVFAALGGITTRYHLPYIIHAAEAPGRFIWNILTIPANFEGKEVWKRANETPQCLWSCSDMYLVQNNNALSSISDLTIGDMNKPIVDALGVAASFDVRKTIWWKELYNSYTKYIPENYREVLELYRDPFKYPHI